MTLQRSNQRASRQNKNNRTDETSGCLISPKLSSSLFWRWSRVFCLGVYSTHALAQHLHVHMSHSVQRTTTTGWFFAENIFCSHFPPKKSGWVKNKFHESVLKEFFEKMRKQDFVLQKRFLLTFKISSLHKLCHIFKVICNRRHLNLFTTFLFLFCVEFMLLLISHFRQFWFHMFMI